MKVKIFIQVMIKDVDDELVWSRNAHWGIMLPSQGINKCLLMRLMGRIHGGGILCRI